MAGLLRAPWWLRTCLALGGAACFYFVTAVVLGMVPVNSGAAPPADGIEIFLTTNGMHAALVLPLRSRAGDLEDDVPLSPGNPRGRDAKSIHVLIGWGDARVYPQTAVWADLTLRNAATALLGLNGAVMQVVHVARPEPAARMLPVRVSDDGYRRLLAHVRGSLRRDAYGRPLPLSGASHGRGDTFYEAHGRYHPFYTCNEWVRSGLAAAGVRTAVWSPSDVALFYQLRR